MIRSRLEMRFLQWRDYRNSKRRDGEILTVEIDPEKEICMKILVYSVSTIRK